MQKIYKFAEDEKGATAIEYALIASVVGLGIITGLTSLKSELNIFFASVVTALSN